MSYHIRLFTTSPLSTLVPIQAQMLQAGYQVKPAGTNQLDIVYAAQRQPLTVDLTDSTDATTREEIKNFLDAVSRLPHNPSQELVLDVLARAQAVVAIGVPDDFDQQSPALRDVIDLVADAAEGLFQVDGEGFYDGDELILKLR